MNSTMLFVRRTIHGSMQPHNPYNISGKTLVMTDADFFLFFFHVFFIVRSEFTDVDNEDMNFF